MRESVGRARREAGERVVMTASTSRASGIRAGLTLTVVTLVLAETMRVSFPLLYDFAGRIGFTTAAWVVPLIFSLPLLAGFLGRWTRPPVLTAVGAGGLAVARVVMQVQDTPGLAVAVAGTLLGLVGLSAAWRQASVVTTGATVSSMFFLGLAVDTAIRIGLTTWDAAWQSTPFAWAVGLAGPAVLGWLVVTGFGPPSAGAVAPDGRGIVPDGRGIAPEGGGVVPDAGVETEGRDSLWLAMLPGPVFALQTLFLANPAFLASSGLISLPIAGAIVLVGLAGAAAMPAVRGRGVWIARAGLLGTAIAFTGPTGVTGASVWVGLVAGQLCLAALLARAGERRASPGTSPLRPGALASQIGLGAGLGSLALVAVLLPYQISYEIPLGLPQFVFAGLGALIVVVLSWPAPASVAADGGSPARSSLWVRRIAVLAPLAAVAVPVWSASTWPDVAAMYAGSLAATAPAQDRFEVRVATYNIHSAVSSDGRLDPEGIARVLEDGGAEVALLQEVARGWPLAGGLDTAAWLSRRLGADIAYGGAADHQFGNAVLSKRPIVRHWAGVMDQGEGTMRRGYVGVTIPNGGTTFDVWSTHLQHQDHTTATRRAQAERVLAAWAEIGQPDRTIFGGDLNSLPGSPDIEPWFDGTGLLSAQDEAGDPGLNTSPAENPTGRIDWILGTSDVEFIDAAVPRTLASDHLPVFATVVSRVPLPCPGAVPGLTSC